MAVRCGSSRVESLKNLQRESVGFGTDSTVDRHSDDPHLLKKSLAFIFFICVRLTQFPDLKDSMMAD